MNQSDSIAALETPQVYVAICNVAAKLAEVGISKDRTAQTSGQGSYKFRGIDDVYNTLAPYLAEAGLCILPRVIQREQVERTSAKGNALFYTTVQMEFAFVSSKDGTSHIVSTFGEAMDSGDKGTNKAMSAAYKYAAMQAFCIPTEGDNDSENQTHTVMPRTAAISGNAQAQQPKTPGPRTAAISEIARLAKEAGVKPTDIPAELAEIGMLPEPIPSNKWTEGQVAAALNYFREAAAAVAGAGAL